MSRYRLAFAAAAFGMWAAVALPLSSEAAVGLAARPALLAVTVAVGLLYAAAAWLDSRLSVVLSLAGVALGCTETLALLADPRIAANAANGYWLLVLTTWFAGAVCVVKLAEMRPTAKTAARTLDLVIPLLFGAVVLYLWEVVVRGFGVPPVLMPPPSAAAVRFAASLRTLGEDFTQTFVRGVLTGYLIGCAAGFLVAIVAHRFTFFGRGLLPLGNFVSSLPIVGIAPIMVMWFGFDSPSKAAVVVIITFFPMLVNTLAGLAAAGPIERDLMHSYGAGGWQTLAKLHVPAAMPFVFNALKINSTLALIGAIVAEFFGTPTTGMGFRISIEAARMSLDMVWAEIALAALVGTAFYGIVALAERATTFWHPSYRT
jgi:NitT/TauT family transport system permease protein